MEPLSEARKELGRARRAITYMESARSLDALDESWANFLRHLERTWSKACAQLKRNPKFQGWPSRGRTEALRSSDPLLAYLRNARGAEEHGIVPIAVKEPGGIGLGPAEGNSLYIEEMRIDRGTIHIKSPDKIRVTVMPGKYVLAPVLNRGVRYEVPKSHLGVALDSSNPVAVARAGHAFYAAALDEAEREFAP